MSALHLVLTSIIYFLQHYISTHTDTSSLSDVKLPITFARAGLTRVRLASDEADGSSADALMAGAAEFWGAFRRREGEKGAKLDVSRCAIVGGMYSFHSGHGSRRCGCGELTDSLPCRILLVERHSLQPLECGSHASECDGGRGGERWSSTG